MSRAPNVIRVEMGDDNLFDSSSFSNKAVDEFVQFLLFFCIRRGRVDDNHFLTADYVTVCVCCRWQCWRSNRKQKNPWPEFDSSDGCALGFRDCGKRVSQFANLIRVRGECSDDMQRWRRQGDLAFFPLRQSVGRPDPLTGLKFSSFNQSLLPFRHPGKKEPGIKSTRRKVRSYPSAGRFQIQRNYFKVVFIQDLLK